MWRTNFGATESELLLVDKYRASEDQSPLELNWARPHFFLRSRASSIELFCLDMHFLPSLRSRFLQLLSSRRRAITVISDPFRLFTYILDEWMGHSTRLFWGLRDEIRATESKVNTGTQDFKTLHMLAKHFAQQTNEVLKNNLNLARAVRDDHEILRKLALSAIQECQYLPARFLHGKEAYALGMPSPSDIGALETAEIRQFEDFEDTAQHFRTLIHEMELTLNAYTTLDRGVANQIDLVSNCLVAT